VAGKTDDAERDAIDTVVDDLRAWRPDLDVIGLPITGRVLRLAQFLTSGREQVLAGFGLTVADFDVLATLRRRAGADAVNVRELQHSMMLSSSGITKRLDRLETLGMLERHPDPGDRRGVLIKLSAVGLDLIERAVPAVTVFESNVVGGAIGSAVERAQLESALRRLLVAQESRER
jgi:DNA-binding MarR family transcriptional regulator